MPFQFHKGTIRTLWSQENRFFRLNFNSIKVQLEPLLLVIILLHHLDFNSIKVQLEHAELKTSFDRYKFQFHKGTIRTKVRL